MFVSRNIFLTVFTTLAASTLVRGSPRVRSVEVLHLKLMRRTLNLGDHCDPNNGPACDQGNCSPNWSRCGLIGAACTDSSGCYADDGWNLECVASVSACYAPEYNLALGQGCVYQVDTCTSSTSCPPSGLCGGYGYSCADDTGCADNYSCISGVCNGTLQLGDQCRSGGHGGGSALPCAHPLECGRAARNVPGVCGGRSAGCSNNSHCASGFTCQWAM